MERTLQLAAALIAVIASGVGVAVAVDQLTLRTRLRRTEAWARELATAEVDEERRAALETLRLRSLGGVMGSHAVPARYFVAPLVAAGVAVSLLVAAILRGEPWLPDLTALIFSSVSLSWMAFFVGTRFYLERARVANAYIAGGQEIPKPGLNTLSAVNGAVPADFGASLVLSLGVNGVAVAAALLYIESENTLGPAMLLGGAFAILWGLAIVIKSGRSA